MGNYVASKIAQNVLKNIVIIFGQKLYNDVAPKIIPNGYFSGQNIVQTSEGRQENKIGRQIILYFSGSDIIFYWL